MAFHNFEGITADDRTKLDGIIEKLSPYGLLKFRTTDPPATTGIVYRTPYLPVVEDLKSLYSTLVSFSNRFPANKNMKYYQRHYGVYPTRFARVDSVWKTLLVQCMVTATQYLKMSGDVQGTRQYIKNIELLFFNFKIDASYGVKTQLIILGTFYDPIMSAMDRVANDGISVNVYPPPMGMLATDSITSFEGLLRDLYFSIKGYAEMYLRSLNEIADIFSRTRYYPSSGRYLFLRSTLWFPNSLVQTYLNNMRARSPQMKVYNFHGYIRGVPSIDMDPIAERGVHLVVSLVKDGFEAGVITCIFLLYFERYLQEDDSVSEEEKQVIVDKAKKVCSLQTITYLIAEVRAKYPQSFFNEWKEYSHIYSKFNEYIGRYLTLFFDPMVLALGMFADDTTTTCKIPMTVPDGVDRYVIRANQLIDYVFHTNTINPDSNETLKRLLKNVSKHTIHDIPGRPQFQTVQIAVNEGTSKAIIPAIVTELIQNSVDAIRYALFEGLPTEERVEIEICDRQVVELRVTDFVGIPISALLGLCIPFLSTKTTSELMTGEMGTGFFNVYRQPYSNKVVIETRDLVIVATPILDVNKKRVLDIEYSFSVIPERQNRRRTDIRVVFNNLPTSARVSVLIDANTFIRSTLGYLPYPVSYNGVNVAGERKLMYEDAIGKCYAMMGIKNTSLLLTNGIPMGELVPFIRSVANDTPTTSNYDLYTGMIIDLNKGYYTPSQSRNRMVKGSETTQEKERLKRFVRSCITNYLTWYVHHATFVDNNESVIEEYLPNTSSKVDLNQFLPYIGSHTKKIFGDPYTFREHRSIGQFIPLVRGEILRFKKEGEITQSDYRKVIYTPGAMKLKLAYDVRDELQATPTGRLGIDLLEKWFVGKKLVAEQVRQTLVTDVTSTTSTSTTSTSTSSNAVVISERDALLINRFTDILRKYLKVYYTIGRRVTFEGLSFDKVPNVKVMVINESAGAHYVPREHIIEVNYTYLKKHLDEFLLSWDAFIEKAKINKITAVNYAKTDAYFRRYIGLVYPHASLMIHEIQHALRGTDHTSATLEPHGPATIKIGTVTHTNATFEEGCNLVCSAIIGEGLWLELLSEFGVA